MKYSSLWSPLQFGVERKEINGVCCGLVIFVCVLFWLYKIMEGTTSSNFVLGPQQSILS